jgi:hypothetical protein
MFFVFILLLPPVFGDIANRPCNVASPDRCPTGADCSKLGIECLECFCSSDCVYGETLRANCTVHPDIECNGEKAFSLAFNCRYCYQVQL